MRSATVLILIVLIHKIHTGHVKNLIRKILLMITLTATSCIYVGSINFMFNIRYIDVGHQTASVLILDQDTDGFLDLAVVGGSNLTLLRGDGTGDFKIHETVSAGEHAVDLESGDLDNDGWLDLVIVNHETSYLTLLFGGIDGFNPERNEKLTIDVAPHPHAVVVEDINEDGFLDIIVDDRDRERLRIYQGHGDGTFRLSRSINVSGDPYRGMTITDINGDGHLDVITPNPRSIAIQLGNGTGDFIHSTQIESESVLPFSTLTADFNGDEILDIAAGSGEGPGLLMVWLGTTDGTFEGASNAPFKIARGPTRLNTTDINDDNIDDILVASYLGNEVAIVLWEQENFHVERIKLDDNPWDVAAGDLNGDSRLDLVVANDSGTKITVFLACDD